MQISINLISKCFWKILCQKQWPGGSSSENVLAIFVKFTRKQFCRSSFHKKETLAQVLSDEFCEIFKNTFFIEHLLMTTFCRTQMLVQRHRQTHQPHNNRRFTVKKTFFKISQNPQENTCVRVSFFIKLQFFYRTPPVTSSEAYSTSYKHTTSDYLKIKMCWQTCSQTLTLSLQRQTHSKHQS